MTAWSRTYAIVRVSEGRLHSLGAGRIKCSDGAIADASPLPTHSDEPHSGSLASRLNWLRAGALGTNEWIFSVAAIDVGVAGATTSPPPSPRLASPYWSTGPSRRHSASTCRSAARRTASEHSSKRNGRSWRRPRGRGRGRARGAEAEEGVTKLSPSSPRCLAPSTAPDLPRPHLAMRECLTPDAKALPLKPCQGDASTPSTRSRISCGPHLKVG